MRRVQTFVFLIAIALAATAAGPASMLAQTPTPVGDDPLVELLRLIPEDALDGGVWYRNYDRQLSAMGIDDARSELDPPETWYAAIDGVPEPVAMPDATASVWRENLGFDVRDIDAVLEGGTAPSSISLLRGDFDAATIPGLWEGAGYTATETDGVTWYTLGGDNVLDMDDPLQKLHLGKFSHLALLDGRTVVGTETRASMEQVLALHNGGEGSLVDGPAVALADAPADLVYGGIVDGSFLTPMLDPDQILGGGEVSDATRAQIEAQLADVEAEARRMPPLALALVGVTAGQIGPNAESNGPRSRAVALLVPVDPATAGTVAEVVTDRAETGELPVQSPYRGKRYADLFERVTAEVSPDGGNVIVYLTPAPDVPATLPIEMLVRRELSLFATMP